MGYNQQYFDPEDRENGKDIEFIKCLLSISQKELYNDLHVYEEEGALVVEWAQIPFTHEYGGRFKFVDEDETVMKEVVLPDKSIEYVQKGDEKNFQDDWLMENPGWSKNEYGVWNYIDKKENDNGIG